jgi:hypothetical protein
VRVRRRAQRVPRAISVTNALHHHRLRRNQPGLASTAWSGWPASVRPTEPNCGALRPERTSSRARSLASRCVTVVGLSRTTMRRDSFKNNEVEDPVARCVDCGTAADPLEPLLRSAQPYVSRLYANGTRQRRNGGTGISRWRRVRRARQTPIPRRRYRIW